MKKFLVFVIIALMLALPLTSAATPGRTWSKVKCATSYSPDYSITYKVCNSAVLKYVGAYAAEEGKWVYVFRVASIGETIASEGDPIPLIGDLGVRVEEIGGNQYFAIFSAPYDSEYAGAWPHRGPHDYSTYKRVAWDIFNIAASQISSDLGTILNVGQLLRDLAVGVSSKSGGENKDYVEVHWDWGFWNGAKRNATHYFQFDIKAHPGHLIEFKVKDMVNTGNPDSAVTWYVMIDVLPSPSDPEVISMQSTSDKILNALTGFYYKLRYRGKIEKFYITYHGHRVTIYKIQPDALSDYGKKFGLDKRTIQRLKTSNKPIYFIKDPVGVRVNIDD